MKKITVALLKAKAKELELDIDFKNFNYDYDNYWHNLDMLISEITGNLGFIVCGSNGDYYVQAICYSVKNFQWSVVMDADVGSVDNWKELADKINFLVEEKARIEGCIKGNEHAFTKNK